MLGETNFMALWQEKLLSKGSRVQKIILIVKPQMTFSKNYCFHFRNKKNLWLSWLINTLILLSRLALWNISAILWPDLVFPFSEETIESPFYSTLFTVRQQTSQILLLPVKLPNGAHGDISGTSLSRGKMCGAVVYQMTKSLQCHCFALLT